MAYMKKVSDATKDSGVGGGWFKIHEDAFDGSKWGVDRLIANKGKQVVTIPQCIAPGQYLLRAELIALHGAQSPKGAQFYMVCLTLRYSSFGEAVLIMVRRSALRSMSPAAVPRRRLPASASPAPTRQMIRVSCITFTTARRRTKRLAPLCSSAKQHLWASRAAFRIEV